MLFAYINYLYERILIGLDPVKWSRKKGVKVGEKCRFLGIKPGIFSTEPYLITIGNHVTITSDVKFVVLRYLVWVSRSCASP